MKTMKTLLAAALLLAGCSSSTDPMTTDDACAAQASAWCTMRLDCEGTVVAHCEPYIASFCTHRREQAGLSSELVSGADIDACMAAIDEAGSTCRSGGLGMPAECQWVD